MSDIEELTKIVLKFRDERDWKQFHRPKDLAISINIEASELLEHFLWKDDSEVDKHIKSNKESIGEEVADILYGILILSHDLKIDISKTLKKKMKKNREKYSIIKAKGSNKKYTEL